MTDLQQLQITVDFVKESADALTKALEPFESALKSFGVEEYKSLPISDRMAIAAGILKIRKMTENSD